MNSFDAIRNTTPRNTYNPTTPAPAIRKRRWRRWVAVLIVLGAVGLGAHYFLSKTNQIFAGQGNIFTGVFNLIVSPDKPLIGEDQGEVNVLLMGVGGSGHDGAYLTDTMIVAQINLKSHEVTLLSIPRDFALTLPKYGYNKINAAYAYAYRDDPDTAGDVAIAAAESVTGLTIPYYAVIDFKGFVEAVDDMGGLDITIDKTFTDATFPNDYPYDTKGYLSPVTFKAGPAHMNGRTALIFARSRHSADAHEGSDFARSERQKKILVAFKDKVLSLNLSNLATLNNLLSDFTNNFRTNFQPYEMKRLADLAQDIPSEKVYSFSLEPDGKLICSALVDPRTGKPVPAPVEPTTPTTTTPPTTTDPKSETPTTGEETTPAEPEIVRMYVVMPCGGKTLADIQVFIQTAPLLAKLKKEGAVIEVQNSVGVTGLAAKLFGKVPDVGPTVNYVTFKGKTPYDLTMLYDNSLGTKPRTLEYLTEHYTFITSDVRFGSSTADFVIVLGKDAVK